MPYTMIEKMYTSLSVERQREAYDYICYLFTKDDNRHNISQTKKTYSQSLAEFRSKYTDLLENPDEADAIDSAFENLRDYDEKLRGTSEETW